MLEYPLKGDLALIKAFRADTLGNLVYRKTARNFGPVMATAAKITIVQVSKIVEPGEIDPEAVITPGIFVDRVVQIAGVTPRPSGSGRMTTRPMFDRARPLGRDDLARLVAADIPPGSYVNLGIGQPTRVADF